MAVVSSLEPRVIARQGQQTLERRLAPIKHLVSAKTIDSAQVDYFCDMAEAFETGRIAPLRAAGKTVALLFFQPSTRTRMGFEAATIALGAHCMGIEDMSASRSNVRTGESLEDCAAVVSRLCDAL